MKVLVTGSAGLIGSEAVDVLRRPRASRSTASTTTCGPTSSGPQGDTTWNRQRLEATVPALHPPSTLDIRDRAGGRRAVRTRARYELVIHAAAQPSHDLAAKRARSTTSTSTPSARSTCSRRAGATRPRPCSSPSAPTRSTATTPTGSRSSSSRPAGTTPTRADAKGIDETMSIDGCLHSLFGASKVAADVLTQEYGRYFGLQTGVFRGGCLTGPHHSGVELHGFLSYLVARRPDRRAPTRSSATRGSRSATRSTRPT